MVHRYSELALSSLQRASVDGESFQSAPYSTAHSAWLVGHPLSCCWVNGSDQNMMTLKKFVQVTSLIDLTIDLAEFTSQRGFVHQTFCSADCWCCALQSGTALLCCKPQHQ